MLFARACSPDTNLSEPMVFNHYLNIDIKCLYSINSLDETVLTSIKVYIFFGEKKITFFHLKIPDKGP